MEPNFILRNTLLVKVFRYSTQEAFESNRRRQADNRVIGEDKEVLYWYGFFFYNSESNVFGEQEEKWQLYTLHNGELSEIMRIKMREKDAKR
jgi:hypothetical protein